MKCATEIVRRWAAAPLSAIRSPIPYNQPLICWQTAVVEMP